MAATTASRFLGTTLRPEPQPGDASSALPQLVQRIATERDGLKNVTEAKLQLEIANEASGLEAEQSDHDGDDDSPKDVTTQQKELWASRNELLQFLDQVRNPIHMALDTTSFQLREHNPQAVEQTLSPFVKENFKQGALGLDKLEPKAKPKPELDVDEVTATGWSLQNLSRSADVLLESARKLNKEVEKETRYWQGVSEVKRRGWNISRVPRQRNTVGVRFGFSEAGPLYQGQGQAALRANEKGDLVLDRGLMREHKHVRVRIEQEGRVLGESNGSQDVESSTDIQSRIHKARDSLFEDELFHEMACEARGLLAYNVKLVRDAIRVPLPSASTNSEQHLVISLTNLEDEGAIHPGGQYDERASSMALACRVLLTNLYRGRFRRRSHPPAPLSSDKKPDIDSHILRSLLNYVRHQAAVGSLADFTTSLANALHSAGAKFSHEPSSDPVSLSTAGKTPMETLVESLSGPHNSSHNLTLPSESQGAQQLTLTVEIETTLAEPVFGSSYRIRLPNSQYSDSDEVTQPAEFTDLESLFAYVRKKICQTLAKQIVQQRPTWGQVDTVTNVLRKSVIQSDGTGASAKQQRQLLLTMQDGKLVLAGGHVDSTAKVLALWPGPQGQKSLFDLVAAL